MSGATDGDPAARPGACLSFVVSREEAGPRLDLFLHERLPARTRSAVKRLIESGAVSVNGRPGKPALALREGDEVRASLPGESPPGVLRPEPRPLDILYADSSLAVLNKPPGLTVHPGAGAAGGTLAHALLFAFPEVAGVGEADRPGIVHRLDRDTSGVMVAARTAGARESLAAQFAAHSVEKEYLALVYGVMKGEGGEVRTLVARHPSVRTRMAVAQDGAAGREAVTLWRVEETYEGEASLLRVSITTGRTHQIRVHMSHLGHPVAGDQTYGGGKKRAGALRSPTLKNLFSPLSRQMLHALRLAFTHPETGARLAFTAPLPPDFAALLSALRGGRPYMV